MVNQFLKSVVFGLFCLATASCGPQPKEYLFEQKRLGTECELAYKCLTEQQRKQLSILYVGSSEAECKSVMADQAITDDHVRHNYDDRNYVESAGQACLTALSKLTCDDYKKILAQRKHSEDPAANKAVLSTLGYPEGFSCHAKPSNACLTNEPACGLISPQGACFMHKISTPRDTTKAASEAANDAAVQPTSTNYSCGSPLDTDTK